MSTTTNLQLAKAEQATTQTPPVHPARESNEADLVEAPQ